LIETIGDTWIAEAELRKAIRDEWVEAARQEVEKAVAAHDAAFAAYEDACRKDLGIAP
jgi:hypothetical protein